MKRHITLLLKNGTREDLDSILQWCRDRGIEYRYRYSRPCAPADGGVAPLHYFSVFTDTANYNDLKAEIGTKIMTTDFADFSNVADCDDVYEQEWMSIVAMLMEQTERTTVANRVLARFIKNIEKPEVLDEVMKYSCHMSERQKAMCRDRRLRLCGRREDDEQLFTYNMLAAGTKSGNEKIKSVMETTGMSVRSFSEKFGIPVLTVERWLCMEETCEIYLADLIEYKIRTEDAVS